MTFRVLVTAAALAALALAPAYAEDPKLPPGYTCSDVRDLVARYGEGVAITMARLKGATRVQIIEARKCLSK